jgi:LemA protein
MMRKVTLLVGAVLVTGCGYGTMKSMDESVIVAKRVLETHLQNRAELVPSLVAAMKVHVAGEDTAYMNVAAAEAALPTAISSGDPERMALANSELTSALARLVTAVERNAALRADTVYQKLQRELSVLNDLIARSRAEHMVAAKGYNYHISRFPASLTAKISGGGRVKYFEVTAETMRTASAGKEGM